jgi:hypothetical protein
MYDDWNNEINERGGSPLPEEPIAKPNEFG